MSSLLSLPRLTHFIILVSVLTHWWWVGGGWETARAEGCSERMFKKRKGAGWGICLNLGAGTWFLTAQAESRHTAFFLQHPTLVSPVWFLQGHSEELGGSHHIQLSRPPSSDKHMCVYRLSTDPAAPFWGPG